MKFSRFIWQCCGLAMLAFGNAQASYVEYFNNNIGDYTDLNLSSTPVVFNQNLGSVESATDSLGFFFDAAPAGFENILHVTLARVTTGFHFLDPAATLDTDGQPTAGTFLDPNNTGTFELYSGDGSSLTLGAAVLSNVFYNSAIQLYSGATGHHLGGTAGVTNITYSATVWVTQQALPVTAVPLPGSAWVMLSGMIGLLGASKRKQQALLSA